MKLKMGVALQMEREPCVSVRTNSTGALTPVRVTTEPEAEGPPQTRWGGKGRWSLRGREEADGASFHKSQKTGWWATASKRWGKYPLP